MYAKIFSREENRNKVFKDVIKYKFVKKWVDKIFYKVLKKYTKDDIGDKKITY